MLPILIATGIAAAVGFVAVHEHRNLRQSRRDLFAACVPIVEGHVDSGIAEFPRLRGVHRGRPVHAEIIPDTMTMRRLPQLWLSLTVLDPLPLNGGFAVLVRPSGNDYYSLTQSLRENLAAPRAFPWEVLVRGTSVADQRSVEVMSDTIASILSDPKVKEVAVTPKGVRIIRQAGEGRRGEHLLLRQAIFDDAVVPPEDFTSLLRQVDQVCRGARELENPSRER